MNETTTTEPTNTAAECCAEVDQCIRRNPGAAILFAVGAGLAIGLIVRALRPEPTPQYRLARMIDDLESRLRDLTGPVLRKAGALAHDAQDGEARVERLLGDAMRRMRRFFSCKA